MSTKSYFHKYQRPVYTCLRCVNSTPIDGRLYFPVFQKNVHPDEKACIYKDVKK